MMEIGNNVYGIKRLVEIALNHAQKPTHLIRLLIEAVFNPSELKNVTLTGQSPRAQGEGWKSEKSHPLNSAGKKTYRRFYPCCL